MQQVSNFIFFIAMKAELGKTYTDVITGFTGVCTSITTYLTGCDRVGLTCKHKDNDKEALTIGFDVNSIVYVDDGVHAHFNPEPKQFPGVKQQEKMQVGGPALHTPKNLY